MKRPVLWGILLMALLRCSADRVAGTEGSGETTNGIVMGYIRNADNVPAANARVILLALPTDESDTAKQIDTTVTSSDGFYRLRAHATGSYQIAAWSKDSDLVAIGDAIQIETLEDTVVQEDTLRQAATLRGSVDILLPRYLKATITLRKTPFHATVNSDGKFSFPTVPPGQYELWCTVRDTANLYCLAAQDSIVVVENIDIVADTLRVPILHPGAGALALDNFDDGTLHNNALVNWNFETPPRIHDSRIIVDTFDVQGLGASATPGCLYVNYTLDTQDKSNWLTIKANLVAPDDQANQPPRVLNAANLLSVTLWVRGTGHRMLLNAQSRFASGVFTMIAVESLPSVWTQYTIDIDSLEQTMSSSKLSEWIVAKQYLMTLKFPVMWPESDSPAGGEVWIDDIRLTFR